MYSCKWLDCESTFNSNSELFAHIKEFHVSTGNHKCKWDSTCNFTSRYTQESIDHLICHLDKSFRPYKCLYCTKCYRSYQDLKRHEKLHLKATSSILPSLVNNQLDTQFTDNLLDSSIDALVAEAHKKSPKPSIKIIGRHPSQFESDFQLLFKVFGIDYHQNFSQALEYYKINDVFVPLSLSQEIYTKITHFIELNYSSVDLFSQYRLNYVDEKSTEMIDKLKNEFKSSLERNLDIIFKSSLKQSLKRKNSMSSFSFIFDTHQNNYSFLIINIYKSMIAIFNSLNTEQDFSFVEPLHYTKDCSKSMIGLCIKWPNANSAYSRMRFNVDFTSIFTSLAVQAIDYYKSFIWKTEQDALLVQELCCGGLICNNRQISFTRVDLRFFDGGMVVWTRLGVDHLFVEATLPDVIDFKEMKDVSTEETDQVSDQVCTGCVNYPPSSPMVCQVACGKNCTLPEVEVKRQDW